MKKITTIFAIFLIIVLVAPSWAIDQTKKIAIGGYFGYGFGFGDMFKKHEIWNISWQNKATFAFGAKAKYGLTNNFALVAALDYQATHAEVIDTFGIWTVGKENGHWLGLLVNGIYTFSPEKKTCPYLTGGVGYYIPDEGDSKPGINLGGGVEHFFKPNLALDAGARFHMIFTEEENTTYVQIVAGLNYYFGTK